MRDSAPPRCSDSHRRTGPRYAELKDNDGVRLLVRLLYHGMQE